MALSKEESCHEKCDADAHISLPQDLIDRLKNVKSWEEWPCRWTFDEERMSLAWLWPHCIGDDKLHQLHLANRGVVVVEQNGVLGSEEFKPEIPQNNEEK